MVVYLCGRWHERQGAGGHAGEWRSDLALGGEGVVDHARDGDEDADPRNHDGSVLEQVFANHDYSLAPTRGGSALSRMLALRRRYHAEGFQLYQEDPRTHDPLRG
jgi:hypothetical protein